MFFLQPAVIVYCELVSYGNSICPVATMCIWKYTDYIFPTLATVLLEGVEIH